MKLKILIQLSLASLLIQACSSSVANTIPENKFSSHLNFVDENFRQNKNEIIEQEKALYLLFELSLKKGNLLEVTREDNYEYPVDFTSNSHQVALLSAVEKKVVIYDFIKNEFVDCTWINDELGNQFSTKNIVATTPMFIRFSDKLIIIIFLNKFMLFDQKSGLTSSHDLDKQVRFVTEDDSKLLFWHTNDITVFNHNTNETNTYTVNNDIHYAGILSGYRNTLTVNPYDNYFTYVFDYELKIVTENKSSFPFVKLPEVKRESVSLDFTTDAEYVWYLWQNQDGIALVDKHNGSVRKILLGLNITKDNLFYKEDERSGLRITSSGNTLFFMVMKNDYGVKKIKIFYMEK